MLNGVTFTISIPYRLMQQKHRNKGKKLHYASLCFCRYWKTSDRVPIEKTRWTEPTAACDSHGSYYDRNANDLILTADSEESFDKKIMKYKGMKVNTAKQ